MSRKFHEEFLSRVHPLRFVLTSKIKRSGCKIVGPKRRLYTLTIILILHVNNALTMRTIQKRKKSFKNTFALFFILSVCGGGGVEKGSWLEVKSDREQHPAIMI